MHGAVLVVDEQDVFDLAAPVLRRELECDRIIHERNLAGALARLKEHTPIELVLADWDLAGPPFISALRADPATQHIPLIVTSHHDTDEEIAACIRLGASDHLAKPFLAKGLAHKLQRLVQLRERRRLRRVHPPHPVMVTLTIPGSAPNEFALADISAAGCQLRVPRAAGEWLRIYQQASLTLEGLHFQGELLRIAADPDIEESDLLVAFHFHEPEAIEGERFAELLDDWREAWQQREEK